VLFEAGCGVGNFLFPLLDEDVDKQLFIYACDFSPRAVNFVKVKPFRVIS
jgi:methyltransferase-like protein 6